MDIPAALGMQPGWIYEIVAATWGLNGPHAAPVGVSLENDGSLRLNLYKGSATLGNILRRRVAGFHFYSCETSLYEALWSRQRLHFVQDPTAEASGCEKFCQSSSPRLEGAQAWLAVTLAVEQESENLVRLTGRLTDSRIFGPVTLINRAGPLLLESMILSTRRALLPAETVCTQLLENARVIAKVAPGSAYEAAMQDLLARIGIESPQQS